MVEENIKYDEKTIEEIKNPLKDYVAPGKEKPVGYWLLATAGSVFFMICLGGYTRLSKSGLSMTKWKPIGYRYPPNEDVWNEEFENYKKYPEYQIANKGMTLSEFKFIFFWEYFHRLWGNVIGGLYFFPFAFFWARGYLKPKLRNRCLGLLALGASQGLIGWWMVKSGFKEKPDYQSRPRVSTYRLFVHLNTAITIYSILLWNGLNLIRPVQEKVVTSSTLTDLLKVRGKMILLLHFVAFNIISGVTVAGIDAGKVFNTWPDMNGSIVPADYLRRSPTWTNFFENCATVQFNHRTFAYLTYGTVSYLYFITRKMNLPPAVKGSVLALFVVVNFQLIHGITMLLKMVPVEYGVTHQANALIVLTTALVTLHSVRKPNAKFLQYLVQTAKNTQAK